MTQGTIVRKKALVRIGGNTRCIGLTATLTGVDWVVTTNSPVIVNQGAFFVKWPVDVVNPMQMSDWGFESFITYLKEQALINKDQTVLLDE